MANSLNALIKKEKNTAVSAVREKADAILLSIHRAEIVKSRVFPLGLICMTKLTKDIVHIEIYSFFIVHVSLPDF